jgi:2-polyprenyl-3-methyl-5-hydroxy-6-metoxy-1,4-benzoquinol methylase
MKESINYHLFWKEWFRKKELYEKINRPDIRLEAIKKYIKGKNVLDFGSGTGYFIHRLANEGIRVTGIDFFEEEKVRKVKSKVLILLKSIKHLKLLEFEEKFDTIIASEVLEHLKTNEIYVVLKFFFKWLKERGRLIITVPYKEKIERTVLCPYCLRRFHPWLHKQTFDERNICQLLKKHGFVVEKIRYITFLDFMNLPSFLKYFLNLFLTYFSNRGKIWMAVISKKK